VSTTKANLGPGAVSLAAQVVSATVTTPEGDTSAGRVEWLGETSQDARELLTGPGDPEERSATTDAVEWLKSFLDSNTGDRHTATAGEVLAAARKDGIAERTLQRARKIAGVTTQRVDKAWIWGLDPSEGASQGAKGESA
jgi:hypothetical protein